MVTQSQWKMTLGHVHQIERWANQKGYDLISNEAHFLDQLITSDFDLDGNLIMAAMTNLISRVLETPTRDHLPEIAHVKQSHAIVTEVRAMEATLPTHGGSGAVPSAVPSIP
ncbi:MAG: hypothetical protein HQL37_16090 [Alphaproteobacteria bacterium]|nr:hypothetical protein [Alphaproteobacteria bacterium]